MILLWKYNRLIIDGESDLIITKRKNHTERPLSKFPFSTVVRGNFQVLKIYPSEYISKIKYTWKSIKYIWSSL